MQARAVLLAIVEQQLESEVDGREREFLPWDLVGRVEGDLEALLALGEMVEKVGDDSAAAEVSYRKLLEEYPTYPMTEVVRAKIE